MESRSRLESAAAAARERSSRTKGCSAHPSCPPASRRPPPAAVPCALRGSPQAPNLLRLNSKKHDQFGPASHPSSRHQGSLAASTIAYSACLRQQAQSGNAVASPSPPKFEHAALQQAQQLTQRSRQHGQRCRDNAGTAPQAQRHLRRKLAPSEPYCCTLAPGLSLAYWRQGCRHASDSVDRTRLNSGSVSTRVGTFCEAH